MKRHACASDHWGCSQSSCVGATQHPRSSTAWRALLPRGARGSGWTSSLLLQTVGALYSYSDVLSADVEEISESGLQKLFYMSQRFYPLQRSHCAAPRRANHASKMERPYVPSYVYPLIHPFHPNRWTTNASQGNQSNNRRTCSEPKRSLMPALNRLCGSVSTKLHFCAVVGRFQSPVHFSSIWKPNS